VNDDKNSRTSIGEIPETSNIRNNERMQDVGSLVSSQSCENIAIEYSVQANCSNESSSIVFIRLNGIERVEENNVHFYVGSNGIRRTGRMEDQAAMHDAPNSIESPCGFVSGSRSSIGS
jgi:hypothetical protein